jgi:hypothetical protein
MDVSKIADGVNYLIFVKIADVYLCRICELSLTQVAWREMHDSLCGRYWPAWPDLRFCPGICFGGTEEKNYGSRGEGGNVRTLPHSTIATQQHRPIMFYAYRNS